MGERLKESKGQSNDLRFLNKANLPNLPPACPDKHVPSHSLPVCSTSLPHFNKAWQNTVHYEGNYAPIFHCLALNKKTAFMIISKAPKNSLTKSHSTKFTNHHESKPKPSNILQLIEKRKRLK